MFVLMPGARFGESLRAKGRSIPLSMLWDRCNHGRIKEHIESAEICQLRLSPT